MVQTSSTTGLENIKKVSAKIEASGIKMIHPLENLPKVVIYDVPKGDSAAEQVLFTEKFNNNIITW